MQDLTVESYGAAGLEWKMRAPVGEAFTAKHLMRVRNLEVELFEAGEKSTDIRADRGVMMTGEEAGLRAASVDGLGLRPGDMVLSGDVVVVSTDGTKLLTDWLHFQESRALIVSTAPVTVVRNDSITRGTGMEATADLQTVKIFNQTLIIPDRETP